MPFHPRSIFRSRFFWFALPGLIFLLWGWFNDPAYYNGIHFSLGDHVLTIADNGRQACLDLTTSTRGHWGAPRFGLHRWTRAAMKGEQFEQALFSTATRYEKWSAPPRIFTRANIAYWLLILLYLAALLAIRLWWQRRKTRLIAAAHPQPSTSHS